MKERMLLYTRGKIAIFSNTLLFTLSILFICQVSDAQIQLGVKAGYNNCSVPFTNEEYYTHKNLKTTGCFNWDYSISLKNYRLKQGLNYQNSYFSNSSARKGAR